jgi:hypothetical protein
MDTQILILDMLARLLVATGLALCLGRYRHSFRARYYVTSGAIRARHDREPSGKLSG